MNRIPGLSVTYFIFVFFNISIYDDILNRKVITIFVIHQETYRNVYTSFNINRNVNEKKKFQRVCSVTTCPKSAMVLARAKN